MPDGASPASSGDIPDANLRVTFANAGPRHGHDASVVQDASHVFQLPQNSLALAFVLVATAVFVAACGGTRSKTDLEISYYSQALGKQTARLRCEPAGGIPRAARACARLRARPTLYLGRDDTCAPLTDVSVTVDGRFRGRKIKRAYDCNVLTVDLWVSLAGFRPTSAG